jgi:hypothetical protein
MTAAATHCILLSNTWRADEASEQARNVLRCVCRPVALTDARPAMANTSAFWGAADIDGASRRARLGRK